LRIDVADGDDEVVFKDDAGVDFAGNDLLEKGLAHGGSVARRAGGVNTGKAPASRQPAEKAFQAGGSGCLIRATRPARSIGPSSWTQQGKPDLTMAKLVIRTKGLPSEVLDLKNGVNRIGRSSGNDFMIMHDTLSRFHCEVEVKEDSMWVRDLDSSNGTFLNDQPVEQQVQLEHGSLLQLGEVVLEVTEVPEPAAEEEVTACTNHPTFPASMICVQCKRVFCGACIHILKRSGGRALRLCPMCSGHCEPLVGMNVTRANFLGAFLKKLFTRGKDNRPFLD
jgi:hypothetical protein